MEARPPPPQGRRHRFWRGGTREKRAPNLGATRRQTCPPVMISRPGGGCKWKFCKSASVRGKRRHILKRAPASPPFQTFREHQEGKKERGGDINMAQGDASPRRRCPCSSFSSPARFSAAALRPRITRAYRFFLSTERDRRRAQIAR